MDKKNQKFLDRGSFYQSMKKFEDSYVGKNHDYRRVMIADLEAEYVNCPIYVLMYWYKKIFFSFLSQTVLKESLKDIPIYNEEDLCSNEHYNEITLPQYLKRDFLTSLQLFAANIKIANKINLGSLKRSSDY